MIELIKFTEINGDKLVNARDLWAFIESKRQFGNWINEKIEKFELKENIDYSSFNKNVKRGIGSTFKIEYALKISSALKILFSENNEKANEFFNKFIENIQNTKFIISSEEFEHFKIKTINNIIYVDIFDVCKFKKIDPLKWFNSSVEATKICNELEKLNIPLIIYLESVYFHIDLAIAFEHSLYKYQLPLLSHINQKKLI